MTEIVLDTEVRSVIDLIGEATSADLESLPVEEALQIARPSFATSPPPAGSKDIVVPIERDTTIPVRLYFPEPKSTKLPVLVYIHGGGFVAGSVEMDDITCHRIAGDANCIVASVGYRLAPEHPFPIAIEDAFSVWSWVGTHAETFGGDVERCAISAASAGGHIAVGAALLARSRGARKPLLQLLIYPVLDPNMSGSSYTTFANGPFMTQPRMAWYWKQYAGTKGRFSGELWDPLSADPAGLPPAHIVTAEYDVLRDKAEDYAAHLSAVGIPATVERHAHMVHGFISIVPNHNASVAALKSSAAALRKAFANHKVPAAPK